MRIVDPARGDESWTIEPLPGGASNLNLRVRRRSGDYVLQIPGENSGLLSGTREHGLEVLRAAAATGVAPSVVAYSGPDGVCVLPFIDGESGSSDWIRAGDSIERVGRLLRQLHDGPAIGVSWSPVDDARRYAEVARRDGSALPDDSDRLLESAVAIQAALDAIPGARGLCHNDLQPQNFIDAGERLWLIDWEWAGMANRYFDLGGVAVNCELEPDEVDRLLRAYFGAGPRLEVLQARVELMRVVSGVREATWALVAARVLTNDWDYGEWARQFFARARSVATRADCRDLLALACEPT